MKVKVYTSTPPFDLVMGFEGDTNVFGYSNISVSDAGDVTYEGQPLSPGGFDFDDPEKSIAMMDSVLIEFLRAKAEEKDE